MYYIQRVLLLCVCVYVCGAVFYTAVLPLSPATESENNIENT